MVILALFAITCRESRATPRRRAVYVQDPAAVVQPGPARDRLHALLESRTISDVVPYGLGPLLENAAGRAVLARWIDDLHARGARVIAPIAHASRLVALDVMVREHPGSYLDGLITELEYWRAEDRPAAFASMLSLIGEMRARAITWSNPALKIGAYLGYPTAIEAERMARSLDFVFLNYSVTAPERAWAKTHASSSLRDRYKWFVEARVEAWPIFYATGEVDMRAALKSRGIAAAERTFDTAVATDPELSRFAPAGFAYFTFEAMP